MTRGRRTSNAGAALAAALASLTSAASTAGAAEVFRRLNGAEIAARFTGMEFTDGIHWGLIFGRGGRVTAVETGGRITAVQKGEPGIGSWRVQKNELCFGVGPDAPRCHEIWTSGPIVQLRREGGLIQDGLLQRPEARR